MVHDGYLLPFKMQIGGQILIRVTLIYQSLSFIKFLEILRHHIKILRNNQTPQVTINCIWVETYMFIAQYA